MTVVGYARVSKREQNPKAQEAELHAAGAERVFVDHGDSSRVKDRPQWVACMDYLRAGDVLLVLDRSCLTTGLLIIKPPLKDFWPADFSAVLIILKNPGNFFWLLLV